MYRRISLSNKYFRAGSSRTKEYHLAKTMMVLVKNERNYGLGDRYLLLVIQQYYLVVSQRIKLMLILKVFKIFLICFPNHPLFWHLILCWIPRNVTRIFNDPKSQIVWKCSQIFPKRWSWIQVKIANICEGDCLYRPQHASSCFGLQWGENRFADCDSFWLRDMFLDFVKACSWNTSLMGVQCTTWPQIRTSTNCDAQA